MSEALMADLIVVSAITRLWFALPLIVSVSLVYAATRHEDMEPILIHAVRTAGWIIGFMLAVLVVLYVISWNT
ncbi:MAG: hypothetical protein VB853_10540 [Pirellulales bacterium]|jgi:uncharacterized membrane protein YgaE (UPF0421/DUF939 family)